MDNVTKYRCYECQAHGFDEDSHECSICGSDACELVILCNSCGSWYLEEQECSKNCSAWREDK